MFKSLLNYWRTYRSINNAIVNCQNCGQSFDVRTHTATCPHWDLYRFLANPSQKVPPTMITVSYVCMACGVVNVEVDVPKKLRAVDLEVWKRQTLARIGKDHAARSPNCTATHFEVGVPDDYYAEINRPS